LPRGQGLVEVGTYAISIMIFTDRNKTGIAYLHVVLIKWDVGVCFLEVCIRQYHAFLQHHCGFDDRDYAAGTFEMADIALDGADEERVSGTPTSAQRFVDTSNFDGVADFGASTMTLTESTFGWVKSCFGIDLFDQIRLSTTIRYSDTIGLAVLIDSGVVDDSSDYVAVTHSDIKWLQDEGAGAFTACKTGYSSMVKSIGLASVIEQPVKR
jgi:hypothetical protein